MLIIPSLWLNFSNLLHDKAFVDTSFTWEPVETLFNSIRPESIFSWRNAYQSQHALPYHEMTRILNFPNCLSLCYPRTTSLSSQQWSLIPWEALMSIFLHMFQVLEHGFCWIFCYISKVLNIKSHIAKWGIKNIFTYLFII